MFLIRKKLELFKLAVENAFEHILITDEDGIIIYANKSAEELTGFTLKEMVGKNPGDLWGGHMKKSFYKAMWVRIKEQKKPFIGELKNHKKNGQVYDAEIRVAPVLDKNKGILYFIGVERDITEIKETERLRSELISMAAHQLKTPITAMKWNMEMVFDSLGKRLLDNDLEMLVNVSQAVENMSKLVDAFLNVSRVQAGTFSIEPKVINLYSLCQEVLRDFTHEIKKKKIQIQVIKDKDGEIQLKVDPSLTKIIFQNLISNAIKYTPDRGKIILNFFQQKRGGYLFSIKDTGCGIPKSQQKDIFKKMFRADNVRDKAIEGTGLGLYLVKSILDHAGGKIWFESEENKGTTFFIKFAKSGMKKKKGTRKLT